MGWRASAAPVSPQSVAQMTRILLGLILSLGLLSGTPAQTLAQESQAQAETRTNDRTSTGGAQNLQDILDRQAKKKVDDQFRREAVGSEFGATTVEQLGTLGGASDSEIWREYRYGTADVRVSAGGETAKTLMQSSGIWWLDTRANKLVPFAIYALLGIIVLLAVFFLLRGKIRISGEKTGRKILRFSAIERLGHWILAFSFILLGISGLFTLLGRKAFIPLMGKDMYSTIAVGTKWVHNNVSWAFILALVIIFVTWVRHNIPSKTDIAWLIQGGGIFNKNLHPPAHKFNAGQKIIFWSVILFGGLISVTGVSLLFPFQLPMFGGLFDILNAMGLPQLFGFGELNTALAPQEDMQYAHLWHAILAIVLMLIVIAHIYIGSVGMEGAFDAVGSGEVEEQWAREHHSLWVAEIEANNGEVKSLDLKEG